VRATGDMISKIAFAIEPELINEGVVIREDQDIYTRPMNKRIIITIITRYFAKFIGFSKVLVSPDNYVAALRPGLKRDA
jgi:hypothetical protein